MAVDRNQDAVARVEDAISTYNAHAGQAGEMNDYVIAILLARLTGAVETLSGQLALYLDAQAKRPTGG